ncbi:hypothetical protein ANN_19017 [Periplaneta americana]|uniref:Uncharacterized protein n=1 Tax=Periplaneta americana TaxID=6978 RepID=A0ABQ8SRN6_PERAM|nr:hypothetical protein ANN_19017 [Periplaneta americana]
MIAARNKGNFAKIYEDKLKVNGRYYDLEFCEKNINHPEFGLNNVVEKHQRQTDKHAQRESKAGVEKEIKRTVQLASEENIGANVEYEKHAAKNDESGVEARRRHTQKEDIEPGAKTDHQANRQEEVHFYEEWHKGYSGKETNEKIKKGLSCVMMNESSEEEGATDGYDERDCGEEKKEVEYITDNECAEGQRSTIVEMFDPSLLALNFVTPVLTWITMQQLEEYLVALWTDPGADMAARRLKPLPTSKATKKGYIIDPTIRIETESSQPEDVNKEKINIYLPTVDYFKAKYQLEDIESLSTLKYYRHPSFLIVMANRRDMRQRVIALVEAGYVARSAGRLVGVPGSTAASRGTLNNKKKFYLGSNTKRFGYMVEPTRYYMSYRDKTVTAAVQNLPEPQRVDKQCRPRVTTIRMKCAAADLKAIEFQSSSETEVF